MMAKTDVFAALALFLAASGGMAAEVKVTVSAIERPEPAAPIRVIVANDSDADAPFIDLRIALHRAAASSRLIPDPANPWPCRGGGSSFICGSHTQVLRGRESVELLFSISPATEGVFDLRAYSLWREGDAPKISREARQTAVFFRELAVTQSGDGGPGSLREVLEAGEACARDVVPCRVSFRIDEPLPEEGWYTIRPATPLPSIGAEHQGIHFVLDATTQTAFSGDTNPAGPEVAIDGSVVSTGNGLELRGYGTAVVRGLAIGGFPFDGINVSFNSIVDEFHFQSAIEDNHIGTDPSGLRARPNGSRGIGTLVAGTNDSSNIIVRGNLIAGNGRSGMFIDSGYRIDVLDNRIGASADGSPLPNGASGIYFGPRANTCTVAGNRIAYNRHFGLAIARRANHIHVDANSIAHNAALGIDWGLDGFSGYKFDDYSTDNPFIPPPRILSARYDESSGSTIITGTHLANVTIYYTSVVFVYANDVEEAQGDVFLGKAQPTQTGAFILAVPHDLRGKFIAAYGQRALHLGWSGDYFWTTEFGDVVVPVK
jgi:hypothetical protein